MPHRWLCIIVDKLTWVGSRGADLLQLIWACQCYVLAPSSSAVILAGLIILLHAVMTVRFGDHRSNRALTTVSSPSSNFSPAAEAYEIVAGAKAIMHGCTCGVQQI